MFEGCKRSRAAAGGAVLGLLVATGCGGDEEAGPAEVSRFVGTWDITEGSAMANCGGLDVDQTLVGEVIEVQAAGGGLVADVRGCPLELTVGGGVAMARTGQTCNTTFVVSGLTTPIVLTVTSATFSVDGENGALVQSGTATATSVVQATCQFEAQATGKRRPPG